MRHIGIYWLVLASGFSAWAVKMWDSVQPVNDEMTLAQVFVWKPDLAGKRHGVLVLCPGQNGSSKALLEGNRWRDFARREKLALVGMHFVSNDDDLREGRGYFAASRGSGKALEDGLEDAGLGGEPVLLYGFSGGAHFAMSYAAWKPERVAAFCAYSFAWWSPPPTALRCPALIVCGQKDGPRYGSSLAYFQAGRGQGKPWAWVSLEGLAHEPSERLDTFVREYFSMILKAGHLADPTDAQVTVDNMTEGIRERGGRKDVGVSILPSADLLPAWRLLHHP